MNALLAISEQLLVNSVLSNGAPFSGKSKAGFGLMIVSGFLLFVGLAFLIFGGYLFLSDTYGSDVAALMVGASILLLAAIVAGVSVAILKYRERHFNTMTDHVTEMMKTFLSVADDELGAVVDKNPKATVALASALGFLLGKKIL